MTHEELLIATLGGIREALDDLRYTADTKIAQSVLRQLAGQIHNHLSPRRGPHE